MRSFHDEKKNQNFFLFDETKIFSAVCQVVREIVENLKRASTDHSKGENRIDSSKKRKTFEVFVFVRFQKNFLRFIVLKFRFCSALSEPSEGRSTKWLVENLERFVPFRISNCSQSLMSQLFPTNFLPSNQSFPVDQADGSEQTPKNNSKLSSSTFRRIIPKVLTRSVLSSTNENLHQLTSSNTNGVLSMADQQDYRNLYQHLPLSFRSSS